MCCELPCSTIANNIMSLHKYIPQVSGRSEQISPQCDNDISFNIIVELTRNEIYDSDRSQHKRINSKNRRQHSQHIPQEQYAQ